MGPKTMLRPDWEVLKLSGWRFIWAKALKACSEASLQTRRGDCGSYHRLTPQEKFLHLRGPYVVWSLSASPALSPATEQMKSRLLAFPLAFPSTGMSYPWSSHSQFLLLILVSVQVSPPQRRGGAPKLNGIKQPFYYTHRFSGLWTGQGGGEHVSAPRCLEKT